MSKPGLKLIEAKSIAIKGDGEEVQEGPCRARQIALEIFGSHHLSFLPTPVHLTSTSQHPSGILIAPVPQHSTSPTRKPS